MTTHERLVQFRDQFDAAGGRYKIVSITHSLDPSAVLTDRQRQFVAEAIEWGYYDSPRRCSLTDLAETLEVNKATASGILPRAKGAIIQEFLGESVP